MQQKAYEGSPWVANSAHVHPSYNLGSHHYRQQEEVSCHISESAPGIQQPYVNVQDTALGVHQHYVNTLDSAPSVRQPYVNAAESAPGIQQSYVDTLNSAPGIQQQYVNVPDSAPSVQQPYVNAPESAPGIQQQYVNAPATTPSIQQPYVNAPEAAPGIQQSYVDTLDSAPGIQRQYVNAPDSGIQQQYVNTSDAAPGVQQQYPNTYSNQFGQSHSNVATVSPYTGYLPSSSHYNSSVNHAIHPVPISSLSASHNSTLLNMPSDHSTAAPLGNALHGQESHHFPPSFSSVTTPHRTTPSPESPKESPQILAPEPDKATRPRISHSDSALIKAALELFKKDANVDWSSLVDRRLEDDQKDPKKFRLSYHNAIVREYWDQLGYQEQETYKEEAKKALESQPPIPPM
jgi:hypothetical protein